MPDPENTTLEQDVENEQADEQVPPEGVRHSQRNEVVESILARRHEDLDVDLSDDEYQADFKEPETPDEQPEKKAEGVQEEKKEEKPQPITVKVNGKEHQVTAQEIAEYQKQRAADERFREIAQERERLRQEREAFEKERQTSPEKQAEEIRDEDTRPLAESLIEAIFAEDVDRASKILNGLTKQQTKEVHGEREKASVDPQTVYRLIDQREKQREIVKGVKHFETTYPDLAENFRDAVDARTVIEMEMDPQASPSEIIDRAAQHVQGTIARLGGGKPEPTPQPRPASTPRSKATRRFQPAPPKQRVSAFEEIKKARGQAL
jgi:hypothetical protein